MTYYVPTPEGSPRREIGAIQGIGSTGRVAERAPGAGAGDDDEGRLVRTATGPAGEARAHLARWESEAVAHALPGPAGIVARERTVRDKVVPGALRRQRLAMAFRGDEATTVHWSVPEPPSAADERVWQRVLGRLAGAGAGGGWSA